MHLWWPPSCASIRRTSSIISGVLFVDDRPERGSSSIVSTLRKSVNTFSAHGFPPVHLHQHFTCLCCSFLQFVAELACTLLHCTVKLPLTLTTFNWPQSVYTAGYSSPCCVSILPMSLKNRAYARTHKPSCRSDMTPFTELFRHPFYGEQHNDCNLVSCNFLHSQVISTLLAPNISLSTLFSNTLSRRRTKIQNHTIQPLYNCFIYILMILYFIREIN